MLKYEVRLLTVQPQDQDLPLEHFLLRGRTSTKLLSRSERGRMLQVETVKTHAWWKNKSAKEGAVPS